MNKQISHANAASSEASDASNSSGSTGLSQEKMDRLVSLLQQANLFPSALVPTSGPTTNHMISVSPQISSSYTATSPSAGNLTPHPCSLDWLLDSGANDHICGNLASFTSFYQIKPAHVNLPNGTSILVNHAGNVSFSSQLYLTNVLYSPTFKLPKCVTLYLVLFNSHILNA